MVDLYSKPTISGYNSNPPPDDDSTTSGNAVSWDKHVNKLAGPIKTLVDSINTGVDTLADSLFGKAVTAQSANFNLATSDYGKLFKTSNAITITLLTGIDAGGNFVFAFYNSDATNNLTLGRNAVNINGAASDLTVYPKMCGIAFSDGTDWWVINNLTPDAVATISGNWTLSGNNDFTGVNSGLVIPVQGRLTLTTATPVTTADVTAATTIYFTPYKGNKVALYDGTSKWKVYGISELSIAVPATTNQMYDVFVYDNSGTPTLELTAWTNDTTRATALTTQNGVLVKTGATTRRYVGSFRTTGVSGQTEDSNAKRYVWNYHNRVFRRMYVRDTTDSWTYSTAAWRQANNSAANQIDFVIGVLEDPVTATLTVSATTSGTARNVSAGLKLDAVNGEDFTSGDGVFYPSTARSDGYATITATYSKYVAVGRHYLAWTEYGFGVDTQTWYGDQAGVSQAGIVGGLFG